MSDQGAERGQAAAELLAVLPVFGACALALGQAALIGWAEWSAANGARAGARAAEAGGEAKRAALSAIPAPLDGEVGSDRAGRVRVRVRVPAVLPGIELAPARASASLSPGDD